MRAIPKPKRIRDERYLAWIRTKHCLVCMDSLVEAHHVLPMGGGKMGSKTDDRRTVPLCRDAHQKYHDKGRVRFEEIYGLDLEAEILKLNWEFDRLPKPKRKERKPRIVKPRRIPVRRGWARLRADGFEELREASRRVVERVLSVYNSDYIQKCVQNEPDSLLALVKELESAIAKAKRESDTIH